MMIMFRMEPVFFHGILADLIIQVGSMPGLAHVHIVRDTGQGDIHQVTL